MDVIFYFWCPILGVIQTTLRVDEALLEMFQDVVEREFGKLKGAQNEALRESILLWLAYKANIDVFALHNHRTGRVKILKLEELLDAIGIELASRRFDFSVRCVVKDTLAKGLVSKILGKATTILGSPDSVQLEDVEAGEPIERIEEANTEVLERKLYEAEDHYSRNVALNLVWGKTRVKISVFPGHIVFRRPFFTESFEIRQA